MRLDLWQLQPTWSNIEMLLHRVWGRLKDHGYSVEERNEIAALQALLTRKRDEEREAERLLVSATLALRRIVGG